MTISKTIVTRDDLMFLFSLERAFIERWSSKDAATDHAAGRCNIPPFPRLEGLGKGTRYHLPTVEQWLMDHFHQGGAKAEKKGGKGA